MSPVPTKELSNGQKIPVLGLGTWKGQAEVLEQAVKDAIDIGFRHIDTAYVYQNEKAVGAAIAAKIADGTVKRENLFVVTKLWNIYHHPSKVEVGLRKSLENLGLDYVDLYLIHWPMGYEDRGELFPKDENGKFYYSDDDYVDTYKAMECLVEKGLTKSIGLSNFNSKQIQRVLDNSDIKPVMLQVEIHPWLDQSKLQEFCEERGIALTAYSPLGSPDRPWAKPEEPTLLDDPEIKKIGEKYDKSNAQVCIKYQIQKGRIVIPKTVTKSRLEQNMNVFDFELSDEDMAKLDAFAKGREGRLCGLTWISDHPLYPFKEDVEF